MSEFRLPLSGDVTQTFNPFTWFSRTGESQIGLFNVNMGTSSNPILEQEILERVGTYGKQLGQIGDALVVLLSHLKTSAWSEHDQRVIVKLQLQLEAIDAIKAELQETKRNGTGKRAA